MAWLRDLTWSFSWMRRMQVLTVPMLMFKVAVIFL
jgi:hypothetical protein